MIEEIRTERKSMEIIGIIEDFEGNKQAILSYKDLDHGLPINDKYSVEYIPFNEREIQRSSRGNILVNQSVKKEGLPNIGSGEA